MVQIISGIKALGLHAEQKRLEMFSLHEDQLGWQVHEMQGIGERIFVQEKTWEPTSAQKLCILENDSQQNINMIRICRT